MRTDDLDGVVAVARIAFPDHPEGRACFAERLALAPETCFVLEAPEGVAGYLIAYPWPLEAVPPLDTLLGGLPEARTAWYLHDLALLPEARGQGQAGAGVALLFDRIDAPIGLVSVNDSAAFWQAQGFEPRESPELRAKLASYGPGARYMVRPARAC
ncbi:GNAT family N-acetyltransferase [Sphingomonas sp.]|uniref:GNAT family N-acetyltransferase n=1 Tax=Sphingomonas sp. TaxID=28214 RepID=UPI0025DA453B|nr:GNAT family N-acetyltransferase [Sphingomonas sp.]